MNLDDLGILLPAPAPAPALSTRWGTVTQLSPLRVKLDGDDTALPITPASLTPVSDLTVNARVWTMLAGRQLVVLGVWGGVGVPAGTSMVWRGTGDPPLPWMLEDGRSLLRADYPALFTAIGTTYGAADSSHFNLPNRSGRVGVGQDTTQAEFDTLGETGGAKTHTLTTTEMPTHGGHLNGAGGRDGKYLAATNLSTYCTSGRGWTCRTATSTSRPPRRPAAAAPTTTCRRTWSNAR